MLVDMKKLKTYIYNMVCGMAVVMSLFSCTPDWQDEMEMDFSRPSVNPGNRVVSQETRNVMLLYSAGFNSLTSYLTEDIEDLESGWLPGKNRNDDVVLVYSHFPESPGKYSVPSSPVLARLYAGPEGEAMADTLIVYDGSVVSSSPAQLNEVLSYVKDAFPAAGYGMVFSSHATGYLPVGFYQKPDSYIYKGNVATQMSLDGYGAVAVPFVELSSDPGLPAVKSIGQDQVGAIGQRVSYEMDIADFAEAIPMELDYILFDACLMGGIEVAYELAGKCNLIAFSQAEVLAEGLNYSTITSHLIKEKEMTDMVSVCDDYFQQYDQKTGAYRSATISLVDCDKLEPVADVCREIFSAHREGLASIEPQKVQRFYRSSYHWFYDLESIVTEAGATEEEIASLHNALDQCVLYKGHTPEFMSDFAITTFSGFRLSGISTSSADRLINSNICLSFICTPPGCSSSQPFSLMLYSPWYGPYWDSSEAFWQSPYWYSLQIHAY